MIDRLIGAGGMGLIFRARDKRDDRAVAVKVLRPMPDQTEKDVLRFQREARLLIQLDHPHVLDVFEVGALQNGIPVLVMELLQGRDLRQEIKVRDSFPVDEAVGYVLQAARAVEAVHQADIIHRDVKPQNLFITQLTGARHLKLLDFGISKTDAEGEMTLTATQGTLGTPQYMSPEQILGAKAVDQRTDVWALGVILYFLLAGKLPFTGPSPSAVIAAIPSTEPKPIGEFRNDIPPEVIEVVSSCLMKDPDFRMPSARALVEELTPFGPPDGVIIAPAVDVPSTVPPIHLSGIPSFLPGQQRDSSLGLKVTTDMATPPLPRELRADGSATKEMSFAPAKLPQGFAPDAGVAAPQSVQLRETTEPDEPTAASSRRWTEKVKRFKQRRRIILGLLSGAAAAGLVVFLLRPNPPSEQEAEAVTENAPPTLTVSAEVAAAEPAETEEQSDEADAQTVEMQLPKSEPKEDEKKDKGATSKAPTKPVVRRAPVTPPARPAPAPSAKPASPAPSPAPKPGAEAPPLYL